jgi:hypothetical protein
MSIRTSLLALASIAALAATALAPTSASAFWGGAHFRTFAGHAHGFLYTRGVIGGRPYVPGCGHIGCNMKW